MSQMTITEQLLSATTRGEKAAATRRLNKHVLLQTQNGKNPNMVRAGILAAIKRTINKAK